MVVSARPGLTLRQTNIWWFQNVTGERHARPIKGCFSTARVYAQASDFCLDIIKKEKHAIPCSTATNSLDMVDMLY